MSTLQQHSYILIAGSPGSGHSRVDPPAPRLVEGGPHQLRRAPPRVPAVHPRRVAAVVHPGLGHQHHHQGEHAVHILTVTTVCSAQRGFIFLAMCASKYKTHRSPVAWKSLCSNHWLERIFLTSTETTKIFSKTVNTFTKAVKTFIKAVKTFIKAVNAFNHAATALSTPSKTLTLLDLHIPHLSLTPLYDI